MTGKALASTIALGVGLGAAYVASPLAVWCVGSMVALCVWAGRGLGERERRYVWTVLLAAAVIRLMAVAVLFLVSEPHISTSFFWDGDGVYLKRRAMTVRDFWLGNPVSPVHFSRGFDHGYGWSTYVYVLAYLQYLTGPALFGVHLFNVTIFMTASVMMHRLARAAFGRVPALVGLGLMLFLPTLIAWSVSALKESLYVFLCALGLTTAVWVIRSTGLFRRLIGFAIVVGATVANGTVRSGASLIMIAGLSAGLVGSIIVRRVLLMLLVVVCLPWGVYHLWTTPDIQARIMSQLQTSAVMHRGNVNTEGHSYRLLDSRFYADVYATETMRPDEGLRYLVRAIVSVVVVPLPWQVASNSAAVFLAQQVIWYLLVVFAVVGCVVGLRRDALVTSMLAGLAVTAAAAIALNSGNIGTMVRFRDTIVPFVVWLSAVGAVSTATTLANRNVRSTVGEGDRAARQRQTMGALQL